MNTYDLRQYRQTNEQHNSKNRPSSVIPTINGILA